MYDANHQVIGGNATDQALMKFIGEETYSMLYSETTCTVTVAQGFNSTNKFSQAYLESVGKTFYKDHGKNLSKEDANEILKMDMVYVQHYSLLQDFRLVVGILSTSIKLFDKT